MTRVIKFKKMFPLWHPGVALRHTHEAQIPVSPEESGQQGPGGRGARTLTAAEGTVREGWLVASGRARNDKSGWAQEEGKGTQSADVRRAGDTRVFGEGACWRGQWGVSQVGR